MQMESCNAQPVRLSSLTGIVFHAGECLLTFVFKERVLGQTELQLSILLIQSQEVCYCLPILLLIFPNNLSVVKKCTKIHMNYFHWHPQI